MTSLIRRRATAPALFVAWLVAAPPAAAADPKPAATALGKVPADASAFAAYLRMGETVGRIGQTRAWKQIWENPQVQEAVKKGLAEWSKEDGEWAAVRKFFEQPDNAELPGLVADALSHEVFSYTGGGFADWVVLLQEVAGGARYGPAFQQLFGGAAADPNTARIRAVLLTLNEKPERVKVPDLVFGYKVSDPAKVTAQLKRLAPVLADALKDTAIKGRSGWAKVGGDDFLVLKLDGGLVPWDQIPFDKVEEKEGEFAPLLKHLKTAKLTVAVGVRQGYLLLAVGESADHLAKFGGPGPKLIDRPELAKPLAKAGDRPLTSVGYTSQKLRAATATTAEDVSGMADLVKAGLQKLDLPEELQKAIETDVDAAAKGYAKSIVKPAAETSVSVRTPAGWESFTYDFTPPAGGPARPLTLLNHVGGDPLMVSVSRGNTTPEDYRAFARWVGVFSGHAEKVAAAKIPGAEGVIEVYRTQFVPILRELGDVTEKFWLPALADGQQAVVFDAKWASKQWHAAMPESDRPLPMLELAVVLGVSDRDKLVQALEGYRAGVNKLIAKARELAPPGQVPDFEIPKPQTESADGRTLAHYPIPAEWGIDPQFRPTGGLSDRVAAVALSKAHAVRLLTPTPLKVVAAPLADPKRPLDSVFHINWAGFVDAFAPWGGYATKLAGPAADQDAVKLGTTFAGYLRVFRGYTSVTYREADATVTHGAAVFQDVPAEK